MFASSCQKIIVYRTKDNVTLAWGQILLELSITATGFLFLFAYNSEITSTLMTDVCQKHLEIPNKDMINKTFSLLNPIAG